MELGQCDGTLQGVVLWRRTAGAEPCAVKASSTVLNGRDEATYRKATRLVPTQLRRCGSWRRLTPSVRGSIKACIPHHLGSINVSLTIPDALLQSARISEAELRQEIAVLLFQRDKLTLAQASRFAHLSRLQFQLSPASHLIPMHPT